VLTESGWEDLGKTYIDLHIIANDLQPIQISCDLEKCIVAGARLEFTIAPKLLDLGDDEYTETMSQISEMTSTESQTAASNKRISFSKRLSQSMGLSKNISSAAATTNSNATSTTHSTAALDKVKRVGL
jgi:hypothetical protein